MGEPSRAKEETKKDGGDDGEDERARVIGRGLDKDDDAFDGDDGSEDDERED